MKNTATHWASAALYVGIAIAALSGRPAQAAWEANFAPEATWYPNSNPNAHSEEANYSSNSSAALTVANSWAGSQYLFDLNLFVREDQRDEHRSHTDVREALLTLVYNSVEVQIGSGRVFWGVTEAAHVVDIINQDDAVENIDGEDKLGQPMFAMKWYSPIGDFSGYVLPYFREREFAADNARPQLPLPVHEEDSQYEDPQGKKHVDYAFRWKHYLGPVDFGLSWFKGTTREPRLVPCYRSGTSRAEADGSTADTPNCDINSGFPTQPPALLVTLNDVLAALGVGSSSSEQEAAVTAEILSEISLIPHYDQIEQVGLDIQYTVGPSAFKLEAAALTQLGQDYLIADAGLEYTFSSALGSDADISLVVEYLYDERGEDERFNATFDDDVFVGSRIGLNDAADTQALGGVIIDRNHGSRLYSLEGTRRLSDSILLSIEARFISSAGDSDPLKFAENEDSVRTTLNFYF